MTEQEIREIEERAENARPGKWKVVNDNEGSEYLPFWVVSDENADDEENFIEMHVGDKQTADFIAHSREDVPRLTNEVRQVWAECKQREADIKYIGKICTERYDKIAELTETVRRLQAELDAAKRDMHIGNPCRTCKWFVNIEPGRWAFKGPDCEECMDEDDRPSHEWRGPCAENGGKDE